MPDSQSLIDQATAAGLSPDLAAVVPRIVQIESGGNPNARTGSYTGILQMGPQERSQYGGDSLGSGLALLADRARQFEKQFGRPPDPTEFYLTHQQGLGGLSAHVANPDQPAWINMAGTGEGRQRGEGWARQAIWGNIPTQYRSQFPGGVGDVTSRQFIDIWRHRLEGAPMGSVALGAGPASGNAVALAQAQPEAYPYFPGTAMNSSTPDAAAPAAADVATALGEGLLSPNLGKPPALQLPPAFRPRAPQLKSLATIKPSIYFPRG